jgi:hypothetical protein
VVVGDKRGRTVVNTDMGTKHRQNNERHHLNNFCEKAGGAGPVYGKIFN